MSNWYKFNRHSVEDLYNIYLNVSPKDWNSNEVYFFWVMQYTFLSSRIENSDDKSEISGFWNAFILFLIIN